MQQNCFCKSYF